MAKRPPEPLTIDESLEIINAAATASVSSRWSIRVEKIRSRDVAAIALMWRSGLRISEVLSLKQDDYMEDRVRILNSKNDQSSTRGIDEKTSELIEQWLDFRPESEWLICTMKGTQVNASHYRRLFKRFQRQLESQKRLHPHGMRHSLAMQLASDGEPLLYISRQLGHKTISTTDKYLVGLCNQEAVDMIRKREW